MTKHIHRCLTCTPEDGGKFSRRGFTRHKDRVCSHCRQRGVTVRNGVLTLPLTIDLGDSELRRPDHYAGRGGW